MKKKNSPECVTAVAPPWRTHHHLIAVGPDDSRGLSATDDRPASLLSGRPLRPGAPAASGRCDAI